CAGIIVIHRGAHSRVGNQCVHLDNSVFAATCSETVKQLSLCSVRVFFQLLVNVCLIEVRLDWLTIDSREIDDGIGVQVTYKVSGITLKHFLCKGTVFVIKWIGGVSSR